MGLCVPPRESLSERLCVVLADHITAAKSASLFTGFLGSFRDERRRLPGQPDRLFIGTPVRLPVGGQIPLVSPPLLSGGRLNPLLVVRLTPIPRRSQPGLRARVTA